MDKMSEPFKPVYVSPETISEIEDRARAANVYFMDVPTLLAAYRWMEQENDRLLEQLKDSKGAKVIISGLYREIFFLKRWQEIVINFEPDLEDIKMPIFKEEEYQKWLQSQPGEKE